LLGSIDLEQYYRKEADERSINLEFNWEIFDLFSSHKLFADTEIKSLSGLQEIFSTNLSELSESEYKIEFERLTIDLSWKSSQIEGNTYSLLETERLLKDKKTASGKTWVEALMLLNHKEALDFVTEHPDYLIPLSMHKIQDLHRLLVKELGVERNIRKRRVGITGTNYRPIDNAHQISEALLYMCNLVNNKESVFEQDLLALVLISYIQPFSDGNKRTARIVSNAILMHHRHCPISFRTVDAMDYKKAMLLFYEQNNLSAMKNIFMQQFAFAVKTYF
jgi:Fic family protein